MRLIDADLLKKNLTGVEIAQYLENGTIIDTYDGSTVMEIIDEQPSAYNADNELRFLGNYINKMPKVYRKRNVNWVIVRDLIMQGTSTAGKTSCITRCCELAIDPWGYELKGAVKDDDYNYNSAHADIL